MKHFPLKGILARLVLFGALYVGGYYALAEREIGSYEAIGSGWTNVTFRASYSVGGEFADNLFLPWHCVDRAIRPDHWVTMRP